MSKTAKNKKKEGKENPIFLTFRAYTAVWLSQWAEFAINI